MNILINTLKAVTNLFLDEIFFGGRNMCQIIIDPNGGAMPIEVENRRDGAEMWAYVRFNRALARDSVAAESALLKALGGRGLCQRGIVGGNHSEIVTDFPSKEQLVEYLKCVGVA